MSQVINVDADEVQFVLNDAEFVLESSEINPDELSDIIYSDGTRAILVNGNGHIIEGETQTIVLQEGEDLSQYYVNDESGEILVTDDQDASISHSLEQAEIVQYVDEEGNSADEPQVIYVNEEGFAIQDSDLSDYQIAEAGSAYPLKTVKLETQVVDLEELMKQQEEGETAIIENLNEENGYQYAILKDGKLHIQSYSAEAFPLTPTEVGQEQESSEKGLTDQQILDLSKVTGRNLLTGQTVTLHSYMDKLQKKMKHSGTTTSRGGDSEIEYTSNKKLKQSDGLKSLLNKKLTLGKTTSGKRLVGKIIHIERKGVSEEIDNLEETDMNAIEESDSQLENDDLENVQSSSAQSVNGDNCDVSELIAEENDANMVIQDQEMTEVPKCIMEKGNTDLFADKRKVVIHEKIVSKECFGHISRTLSGLMNMDSVKKKLQYKNIIVKVVEKKYIPLTKIYSKNVSYSSGYMREELSVNDAGEMVENWFFVPNSNTKEAIFGKSKDDSEPIQGKNKYLQSTNITLMITQQKTNDRVIRVILNPTHSNRCSVCAREFRSNLQLRVHINNTHRANNGLKMCEICSDKFDEYNTLQEHRKMHVAEGKLFHCSADDCGKFFLTAGRLKRHSAVHNIALRPLECSVCLHRCSSESSLKKHLMTHMTIKPFYCETCEKSFSNPGDLNFHKRIHDPCKYYACEICKRTFSRHSNLQRHVEIHKGAGELFQCAICGCSYHYMSSLTRHVVQNHIKRTELETLETPVENEAEASN